MCSPPLDFRHRGVFFKGNRNHWSKNLTSKAKQPPSDNLGVVRVRRSKRRQRRAALENPQAFPEISARQQLNDLESPELLEGGDDEE
jgi:hypothetical protein